VEKQKERGHKEYLHVGGRIILKWILERYDGVTWAGFIWHRIKTSKNCCEHRNEPSGSIKLSEIPE
jgi:hypothetical protein